MLSADPAAVDDNIARDWQIEGTTDAAFGRPPEHPDNAAYLDGWLAEVGRRLKAGETMRLRWLSKPFLDGAYDAPSYMQERGEF